MKTAVLLALLAPATMLAAPSLAQTDEATPGALHDVAAWVNRMPGTGTGHRLHMIGQLTTPTPCHDVTVAEAVEVGTPDTSVTVTIEQVY